MGLLVEYRGGLDVEDYHLKYHGDGNGFQVYSNCNNGVINDCSTKVHKGVIELTMEAASMGVISLGHADRYMLSAEEAESMIDHSGSLGSSYSYEKQLPTLQNMNMIL